MNERVIIEIRDLKKYFPITGGLLKHTVGYIKAVDGVNLTIQQGETLGLVGESGCGKSTLGRCILRLIEPTQGQILFHGEDLMKLTPAQMRNEREHLQIIFQDPYASLNPKMTVEEIVSEPLRIQKREHRQRLQHVQRNCFGLLACRKARRNAIRTSFPADSARELALRGLWHSILSLLSAMSRFPHWMFPCVHKF